MDASRPSRTALRVALRRAAHQLYDAAPLVLDDCFAVPLLGLTFHDQLVRTPQRTDRPHSRSLRAWLVARSRWTEDQLAIRLGERVAQYVVLGAGLDTFALRNPFPALRVFEVDHPATQSWKRELLSAAALLLPANARMVAVDFERQEMLRELCNAGFDPEVPTFFSWLGVVPYLTLSGLRSTIAQLATMPSGSGLALDYTQPRNVLPPEEQLMHDSLAARVALAGEPFQTFLTPREMALELRAFRQTEDLGAAELNDRYFRDRADDLRILGSAGRLVVALR